MKKSFKRTLAKGLSVVMAFSMLAIAPADDADAAKAKKPKMAKKSYSVTVGKKVTVKISSKKKVKKTTWSLSKKDKKKISLSKKKAKSVIVKGKKAKTTATLKAKVKVGKKNYKLSVKVKVKAKKNTSTKATPTATPKVTQKSTTAPTKVPAPTALVLKDKDEKSYVIDETKTLNIPVTSLNETAMSCDDKFDTDLNLNLNDYAHVGAEFTKNGASFTTKGSYNYGMSFYLDPITSENDLEDVTGNEGIKEGIAKLPKEGKAKEVDIADYDVIRIAVKTEKELNVRVWNKTNYDKLISGEAGWPGDTAAIYNGWDSTGRGDYVKKEPVEEGSSSTANVYYKDKAQTIPAEDGYIVLPVKEVVKAAKQSSFVALGVCGQFKGQDITIKSIELMKVKDSKSVTAPNSVSLKADGNTEKIVNGSKLKFTAEVLDKNEQVMETEAVEWSVDGDAATIEATDDGATLTADDTKTGEVTVVAASKTDAKVKAEYKVTVCDPQTTLSLGFTNEYTTYTLEEAEAGIALTAEGLNGAGIKAENQPEKIEVKLANEVEGFTYADGKLTATKAGNVTLVATSKDLPDVKVTIKVVDGTRVALTADNTGWVENWASGASNLADSKATVENNVVTYTSSNWNGGAYVKVVVPEGKTVANIAGLLWTYQSDDSSNNDNPPTVSVRFADLTKPNQTGTGGGGADSILHQDATHTADEYKAGVDITSTFDWNFCYDSSGNDVTIDTTGNTAVFTMGKNGPADKVQNFKNIIVLWGEKQEMPKLSSIDISQATNKTETPANVELQLKATATYANKKTKTVTTTAEWTSSDETVATIANGLVTPKKQGTVDITAKIGDIVAKKYTVKVTENKVVEDKTLDLTGLTTEIDTTEATSIALDLTDKLKDSDLNDYTGVEVVVTVKNSEGNQLSGANGILTSTNSSFINGKITFMENKDDVNGTKDGKGTVYNLYGTNTTTVDFAEQSMTKFAGINIQVFTEGNQAGLAKDENGTITEKATVTVTSVKLIGLK